MTNTAEMLRSWQDITPAEATALDLRTDLTIQAPLNENGERCPWPWGPQQLRGIPLGEYHCEYCGALVVAGVPHLDYRDTPTEPACPICTGLGEGHQIGCRPTEEQQ